MSNTTTTTSSSSAPRDALYETLIQQERIIQSAALPADEMPTCMNLFDKWASCFALVPQLRYIYRYGTVNACASKLEDFKYCLTLKGMDQDAKREAYIERKARAMARRRMPGGNTSEEVWQIRSDPIIDPQFVDEAFLNKKVDDAKT